MYPTCGVCVCARAFVCVCVSPCVRARVRVWCVRVRARACSAVVLVIVDDRPTLHVQQRVTKELTLVLEISHHGELHHLTLRVARCVLRSIARCMPHGGRCEVAPPAS